MDRVVVEDVLRGAFDGLGRGRVRGDKACGREERCDGRGQARELPAVVIDPARNAIRVWLLNRGTPTVYTDLPQGDIPWTESVNKFIANATSPK